ncbi:PucR family transcriptional regulator [Paenibacillus campi]|uniref:PucR family transcriptional regulator n=1 Tax=Paenibacillus campi TaxID=3106031 RepID=UPI003A4C6B4B
MDMNELRQRIEQIMGIMICEHHMSEEEWDHTYAVSSFGYLSNLKKQGVEGQIEKQSARLRMHEDAYAHKQANEQTSEQVNKQVSRRHTSSKFESSKQELASEPKITIDVKAVDSVGATMLEQPDGETESSTVTSDQVIIKDRILIPVWQGNGTVVVWEPSTQLPVSSAHDDCATIQQDNTAEIEMNETIAEMELYRLYQLLELLLPSVTGMQPIAITAPVTGPEQEARELGQWLVRQLSLRSLAVDIPEDMAIRRRLNRAMVPFVMLADSLPSSGLQPKQLGKLLSSYFDRNVLLIPLQENEWLILANHGLIEDEDKAEQQESASFSKSRSAAIEEKSSKSSRSSGNSHQKDTRDFARDSWDGIGEAEDTEEDLLTAFALGLHELVASEWGGSFHISVGLPLHPLYGLAKTVRHLRETIHLGRLFQVTEHIHLPWELRLESLLYRIPEEERLRFVESADRYAQLFRDDETVATLETFFKMDCNVSETAKQLYIHRNTLLYRLDRIKQDTQLDVRRFEDAVLMRLTLLLYKVTKS